MEGNFLSRYNNKIQEWEDLIAKDPQNSGLYHSEMSDYIIKCMPYMNQYTDDTDKVTTVDNVFNCKETHGLQRKDIYVDYLIDVENHNINRQAVKENIDVCPRCPNSNIIHFNDTSDLTCDNCGLVVSKMISQELTYREEQESSEKIVNYSYKRENHFNEWMSQFQAQEMTTIPPDVIDKLRVELKKLKIKSLDEITHAKIRGLLKKLKLNRFYEHVPYITNILNGIKPPSMPQELEERLRIMFKDIQRPFDDNCPKERKNFLSYSYVLYKCLQLLEMDDFLKHFSLLKSREKLAEQDSIWKKICEELKWQYIKTI